MRIGETRGELLDMLRHEFHALPDFIDGIKVNVRFPRPNLYFHTFTYVLASPGGITIEIRYPREIKVR